MEKMKEEQLTKKEKLKASAKKFNKEVKKSVNTAILAAFGFLMALVWRDVITEWVEKISAVSPIQGKLVSAITVTLISVLGILVVTKFMRVEE